MEGMLGSLYRQLFEKNRSVQLVIDPGSGRILDANEAACIFYGYAYNQLRDLLVSDISMLSKSEIAEEMRSAAEEERLFSQSRHRLATGEIRNVEIFTTPLQFTEHEGTSLVLHSIVHDVTARFVAFQCQRQLAVRLRSTQEKERSIIAQTLHDDYGWLFWQLNKILETLGGDLTSAPEGISRLIQSASEILRTMQAKLDDITLDLRPVVLDKFGLGAAIGALADRFRRSTGIACTFIDSSKRSKFVTVQEVSLFRIAQEALTNVIRHAAASAVKITLRSEADGLLMEIHDNGVGFDQEKVDTTTSLGVLGMEERAIELGGRFQITRLAEGGTVVQAWVPSEIYCEYLV